MWFPPHVLGRFGEWVACLSYLLRGYRIVQRNLRMERGEIDLVVRRSRTLVLVEVKTRQSSRGGAGFEAVDHRKRERLIRLGDQLLARHSDAFQLRYDILSLRWTGYRFAITRIADAFRPTADPRRPWRWSA